MISMSNFHSKEMPRQLGGLLYKMLLIINKRPTLNTQAWGLIYRGYTVIVSFSWQLVVSLPGLQTALEFVVAL